MGMFGKHTKWLLLHNARVLRRIIYNRWHHEKAFALPCASLQRNLPALPFHVCQKAFNFLKLWLVLYRTYHGVWLRLRIANLKTCDGCNEGTAERAIDGGVDVNPLASDAHGTCVAEGIHC